MSGRLLNAFDDRPFEISIHCDNHEPEDVFSYLEPFMEEMREIRQNGLVINGEEYEVKIFSISCDTPARKKMNGAKGSGGKSGCDRCEDEGRSYGQGIFSFFFSIYDIIYSPHCFLRALDI